MVPDNTSMLLSQLVDGELSSDELNEVLLQVLDDAEGREELKQLLIMRQALRPLRSLAQRNRAGRNNGSLFGPPVQPRRPTDAVFVERSRGRRPTPQGNHRPVAAARGEGVTGVSGWAVRHGLWRLCLQER